MTQIQKGELFMRRSHSCISYVENALELAEING